MVELPGATGLSAAGNDTDCHGRSLSTVTMLAPTMLGSPPLASCTLRATDHSLHQSVLVHPLRRWWLGPVSVESEVKREEEGGKERWIDAIHQREGRDIASGSEKESQKEREKEKENPEGETEREKDGGRSVRMGRRMHEAGVKI